MTTHRYVYMLCLAPLLALWLPQTAQAQRPDDQVPRHRHGKPAPHTDSTPHHQQRLHPNRPATDMPHPMPVPSPAVGIQIGRYFQSQHLEAAKKYYSRPENTGFCPPGLAKKNSGCLPPGQAKLWRKGEKLPPSLVVYDLPRSVVVTLGVPPPGTQYVRVASDILLIAIGTSLVIDAMEDLVR